MSHSPTASAATTPSSRRTRLFLAASASLICATVLLLLPTTSGSRSRSNPLRLLASPGARWGRTRPAAPQFWQTSGSRILDARRRPVRISGLNWSGFETVQAVPGGLEQQDYRAILHTIRANGYNTIRLPFSNQMVETPTVPSRIGFTSPQGAINHDLEGLDSLEILDRIVAAAGEEGLHIILDNHRSEAGSSAEENGLWYTDRYPESAWINDWVTLARRYAGNPTVAGFDLRNEPHNATKGGACWSCGGVRDWHLAAERAGNAVLRANPRLLLFVEGTDEVDGVTTWWGGNLAGVRHAPVHLEISGRLVYSAHVYGPTEYQQPWFNAQTSPASLAALWHRDWSFISESGTAPVWIGEFGTTNDDADVRSTQPGSEGQWFSTLISFLQAHPSIGWTYWGVNGEDRYALLDATYSAQPANMAKAEALASIAAPSSGAAAPARSGRPEQITAAMATRDQAPAAASMTVLPVRTADVVMPPPELAPLAAALLSKSDLARGWRASPPAATTADLQATPWRGDGNTGINETVGEQVRLANRSALQRTGGAR